MTALYEYRVEFGGDRNDEIVETTLPPSAALDEEHYSGLWEEYPDALDIHYVGRVA